MSYFHNEFAFLTGLLVFGEACTVDGGVFIATIRVEEESDIGKKTRMNCQHLMPSLVHTSLLSAHCHLLTSAIRN